MTAEFDAVYYASYRSVLRAVVLLVPSREHAHDLVQDAFAKAFARWDTVGALEAPDLWVRRVAINAAIDGGRREKSRRRAYVRLAGGAEHAPGPDAASVDVARALAALPAAQRRAIVLYYLLDMAVAEIAADTGRPVGTVKADLSRGRAALAATLRTPLEANHDV
jgi:RNA polymerase sigma-70 factor (ECF subfamily)